MDGGIRDKNETMKGSILIRSDDRDHQFVEYGYFVFRNVFVALAFLFLHTLKRVVFHLINKLEFRLRLRRLYGSSWLRIFIVWTSLRNSISGLHIDFGKVGTKNDRDRSCSALIRAGGLTLPEAVRATVKVPKVLRTLGASYSPQII